MDPDTYYLSRPEIEAGSCLPVVILLLSRSDWSFHGRDIIVYFLKLVWTIQSVLTEWHSRCWLSPIHFSNSVTPSLRQPTYTQHNRFTALLELVRDYPGEQVPEETFTHSHLSWYQSSFICFLHLLQFIASCCSINVPESLFAQPLSKSSLVYAQWWSEIM